MKSIIVLALTLAFTSYSAAQAASPCAFNTGNNASMFLDKDAYRSLTPGDKVRAYAGSGCVGEAVLPSDNALAYAVTIWGDDEITPATDGAVAGEPVRIALEQAATTVLLNTEGIFADNLNYAPDRIYRVTFAEFDTTTTRLMDSLMVRLALIEAELDSAAVEDSIIIATLQADVDRLSLENSDLRADNAALQETVNTQLANIQDLQFQLARSETRGDSLQQIIDTFPDVTELQAENDSLRTANAALKQSEAETNAALVEALDRLTRIYYVVLANRNRYKEICAVIPEC